MLRRIIREMVQNQPVPRSRLWKAFVSKTGLKIEKYRFERDVSELIRKKELPGYEMKQGRNGGLVRSQPKHYIMLKTNDQKLSGFVSSAELNKFVSAIEADGVPNFNNKERVET